MPTSSSYKFVYVHVPFPLSLAANGGAENAGKCEEEKKVGKGTTQLWRGNVLRFSHFFFFASLWLSALCFSWQIASDIKFIYAKFARRALSYCPSTKRKTHSTPSTTVHITQGIQYTQCVAYNTPVLAHNCSPAVGVGGGGVTAAAAAACDTLDKHRMVVFENLSSDSRMI